MGIYLSFSYLIIRPFFILTGIYTSRVMIFSIHNFFHFSTTPKSLFWSCILFDSRKLNQVNLSFQGLRGGVTGLCCIDVSSGETVSLDYVPCVAFAVTKELIWVLVVITHLLWWLCVVLAVVSPHHSCKASPGPPPTSELNFPGFKGNFWMILMLLRGCGNLGSYLKLSLHR